ncbi:GNAT family N-acetyltransferase [Acholeplasma equirhinis]|uniref:GNAT family N-acetyltransferase n=1 Tax=Acholeplasma equirhinis TaxID=555393 RepID=UPI00197A97E6|nr:GNAT family N-acetyltransferase [Acholeplasma equirhinis]MBN3490157.1 GNAT family N-acetyltransferase [Acholeplasma equirhinis]
MKYTIKLVESKKDAKAFTELPIKLFKHIDAFVPALSMDEMNVFDPKKNPVHEYCESVRYIALNDKSEVVGRIGGIINHRYNEKFGKKIVRFTRLDMIDDFEVTKLLTDTIIAWGKSKGMNEVIGPIGFTDLDRMGMLVDGFQHLGSFITIWNPPYYKDHLDQLGFSKDVDWIESQVPWPKEMPEKVSRATEIVTKRFGYKLVKMKSMKELPKYVYEAFDVYNRAFSPLYGFLPVTRKVQDYYIAQMKSLAKLSMIWFVKNKEDKIIAFGMMMPSLAKANKKNQGKLLPFGFLRLIKAIKSYDVIDFYFVAVDPEYHGKGVLSLIMEDGIKQGIKAGVTHAETGPELELNTKIQSQWRDYDPIYHKRRRCYNKKI